MTLDQLQHKKAFASWEGHVDSQVIEASRRVYTDTLSKLIALGLGKPESAYAPILGDYIAQFNRLDEQYEFVDTIAREDICEHMGEILDILRLPSYQECDDLPVARDW